MRTRRPHLATVPTSCLSALMLLWGCGSPEIDSSGPVAQWASYGAAPGGGRYSPLTQITAENVDDLEIAWIYHTGDYADGSEGLAPSSFQNTPIVVDGTMYICTPFNRVIALDPDSGEELWVYDPVVDTSQIYVQACRGVSTWLDARKVDGDVCRRRIITGTLDARLIALDAATGKPCPDFGDAGTVDLGHGIGDREPGEYGVTSPPAIIHDTIVTGAMVLDSRRKNAPGGVVRAYDVRSGRLRWSWDPVPPGHPDIAGADVPDDVLYWRGTTNVWSIISVDPERNLVFLPTGNTSPDYFGGERHGLDHYSSSVVALDASTGEPVWSFGTVHHDLWDYDVASMPTLIDFPSATGPVPAVVQTTKQGYVFFLERSTGRPLFEVVERPVPQGPAPGDVL